MKFERPTNSAECPTNSADMTALERAEFILDYADEFGLTAHQNSTLRRSYVANALWLAKGLRGALIAKIYEKSEATQADLLTSIATVNVEDIANAILCGTPVKSAFPEDIQKLTGVWREHIGSLKTGGIEGLQSLIPEFEML